MRRTLLLVLALAACRSPLDPTAPGWVELGPSTPGPRWGHTAALDSARSRVVVFGGMGPQGKRGDLWALSLESQTWQELKVEGGPSPRITAAAVADPARRRMIVVGSERPSSGLDLVLGTRVHWTGSDKLGADLALLAGWNLSERHQLVLGPRLTHQLRLGTTPARRPLQALSTGGTLGWAFVLNERLTLLPEVAFSFPLWVDEGLGTSAGRGLGTQFSLGILF